jgi:hypothetical protein
MGAEALQQQPGLVIALEANFCRVQLEQPGPAGVEQLRRWAQSASRGDADASRSPKSLV